MVSVFKWQMFEPGELLLIKEDLICKDLSLDGGPESHGPARQDLCTFIRYCSETRRNSIILWSQALPSCDTRLILLEVRSWNIRKLTPIERLVHFDYDPPSASAIKQLCAIEPNLVAYAYSKEE